MSLKEAAGIGHIPGFYLAVAQASTSKDLMLDRIVKTQTSPRPPESDKLAPLAKYSVYDLKKVKAQPRPYSDACKREEET
jgi:hypothetical protein